MTDLRQKMLEDMRLRSLSDRTVDKYLGCASVFSRYHGASPADLGSKEVRQFLLHLTHLGRSTSTVSTYHSALTFLFRVTLQRPDVMQAVPRPRVRTQRPGRALTFAEARALLDLLAARPFDYTFFALMLATGLRISEATLLQVHDIDRRAGLLHVRRGKGNKPRTVMLSARTLQMLERYWREVRPRAPFLFPARHSGRGGHHGQWTDRAISAGWMAKRLQLRQGDVPRRVLSHDLRRTFATWLIEDGYDLRLVQVLLGHASPETTARYTRVHSDVIARMRSPFDRL